MKKIMRQKTRQGMKQGKATGVGKQVGNITSSVTVHIRELHSLLLPHTLRIIGAIRHRVVISEQVGFIRRN